MSPPAQPEIWITGAEAVTALGDTLDATWQAMLSGRTAGRWVELGTPKPHRHAICVPAAPVEGELLQGLPLEASWRRTERMSLEVAHHVAATANLGQGLLDTAAVIFATSKPAFDPDSLPPIPNRRQPEGHANAAGFDACETSGALFEMLTHQGGAARVAVALKAGGPILSSVAACSSGLHGLIRGMQWLGEGGGPLAVIGAVESCLNPLYAMAFRRMHVLATGPADAAMACKPFDRERTGFLLGEGAGGMILEPAAQARRRGVRPLAVLAGYSLGTDPTGLTDFDVTGKPLARTIRLCLDRAGVSPSQVICIKAHGTATVRNDQAEAAAVAEVFGNQSPPVISLKGYLGHTLGASGVIEMGIVAKSIAMGMMPGCANLTSPDPMCGSHHPIEPVHIEDGAARYVLCLSAGFGGHLAAVLLRKP
jgi:3-oxoacyl-[acyl-carrier-protein] synthase II